MCVHKKTAHSGLFWQQPSMLAVGEDGDLLNLGEKKKKKKKKQTSEVVVNMTTFSKLASAQGQAPRAGSRMLCLGCCRKMHLLRQQQEELKRKRSYKSLGWTKRRRKRRSARLADVILLLWPSYIPASQHI